MTLWSLGPFVPWSFGPLATLGTFAVCYAGAGGAPYACLGVVYMGIRFNMGRVSNRSWFFQTSR